MTDEDLSYTSAADLAVLIRNRQLSPVEVLRSTLARIERAQSVLNAFITICAEEALAASRERSRQSSVATCWDPCTAFRFR